MLLADIGNTHCHIYDGVRVEHLTHEEAIAKYRHHPLYYISVNQSLHTRLKVIGCWEDLADRIVLSGAYPTMGVDRKALCLSRACGVFVDAGSAITVDVVEGGVYQGGYILAGLTATLESYRAISPALDTSLNRTISLTQLPTTTKDGISYGIIASIKALIEYHRADKPLYFTGGDGHFLSTFFTGSHYDESLVFEGMRKVIKEQKRC